MPLILAFPLKSCEGTHDARYKIVNGKARDRCGAQVNGLMSAGARDFESSGNAQEAFGVDRGALFTARSLEQTRQILNNASSSENNLSRI